MEYWRWRGMYRPSEHVARIIFSTPQGVSAMTRWSCLLLPALAAGLFVISGCSEEPVGIPHDHPEFEVTLCGLCGDIKQAGHDCKEGATICSNCGLHKGSILCCSSAFNCAPRDVILCSKCGEKAFSKKCCRPGLRCAPNADCTGARRVAVRSRRLWMMDPVTPSKGGPQGGHG